MGNTIALVIVSAAHLGFGLGNLLKVPPYNPAVFLVSGEPGAGDTGIEKLLEAVFAGWYTTSILGVLLAKIFGDSKSVRFTLICPLLYHIMSTYAGMYQVGTWSVCNTAVQPHTVIAVSMEQCHSFLDI